MTSRSWLRAIYVMVFGIPLQDADIGCTYLFAFHSDFAIMVAVNMRHPCQYCKHRAIYATSRKGAFNRSKDAIR